jgi:hypothetical protein
VSQPQYMDALEQAGRVRLGQKAVLRSVADGETSIAEALADPRAEGIKVYRLLIHQHRWGRRRVRQALQEAGVLLWPAAPVPVGEEERVGELTDRERAALVQACSPTEKAA